MADETGIVLPWEKDAMAGLEMPNSLSGIADAVSPVLSKGH